MTKELSPLTPNLQLTVHICQRRRCQHQWVQRGKVAPKVCPKCKRYDWQTPRK